MKCAIYIRTASKNNKDFQLNLQSEQLKRYIEEQNWQLYNAYVDIGSGSNKNKNLQSMIADAHLNKFDVIISTEPSRLFRTTELSSTLEQLCENNGIQIITLDGTIDTKNGNWDLIRVFSEYIEKEAQLMGQRIKNGKQKTQYQQSK